jgi:hypothetical protein
MTPDTPSGRSNAITSNDSMEKFDEAAGRTGFHITMEFWS